MISKPTDSLERDQRLQDVVLAYLQAIDAGQKPDQQDLLARHPELAADLRAFFSGQHKIQAGIAPLRGVLEQQSSPPFSKRLFGDYELLKEIAHGGMGIVYKARQISLKRIVALKMIRAGQLASAEDVRRFRIEAENAATLDHPNIVPIYEVGEREGQHYFTMKRIAGGSLAQNLGLFAHSSRAGARLVAKVARAVHHAHQRGILHRDLKPPNILLDARGRPHVTDFGLAKRVEGDAGMTQTGVAVGTPSYMAPEQAAGKKHLTTAVDVYGLGTILYELLTGRPPFWAPTVVETLRLVLEQEPARPRTFNPRLDRDLETICLKCLQKDPGQRYASAEALAEDLEYWLAGEPIEGRRTSVRERALKWAKRRPAVATLVAACALGGVGLVILAVALFQNAEKRAAAVRNWQTAEKQLAEADRERETIRKQLAERDAEIEAAREGQAKVEADLARVKTEAELAKDEADKVDIKAKSEIVPPREGQAKAEADLAKVKAEADLAKAKAGKPAPLATEEIRRFEGHTEGVTSVALSSTGRQALSAGFDRTLRVWDVETGDAQVRSSSHPDAIWAVALSPDGRYAVSGGQDYLRKQDWGIRLWDMKTGQEIRKLTGHQEVISSLAFSRDSRQVISGCWDGTIRIWDVEGKKPIVFQFSFPIVSLAPSPNERRILVGSNDGFLRVIDRDKGQQLQRFRGPRGSVESVAFSPDGRYALSGGANPSIQLYDLEARREVRQFTGHAGKVDCVAFSLDGNRILSSGEDKTIRLWDLDSGKELHCFRGHQDKVRSVAFSPDGRHVISGSYDKTVRLWRLPAKLEIVPPGDGQAKAETDLARVKAEAEFPKAKAGKVDIEAKSEMVSPRQLAPADESQFSNFPRKTTVTWAPVTGAATYKVEVEYRDGSGKWVQHGGIKETGPFERQFDFVGAQPGRWRVWAVSDSGVDGPKSDWWTFRYTR